MIQFYGDFNSYSSIPSTCRAIVKAIFDTYITLKVWSYKFGEGEPDEIGPTVDDTRFVDVGPWSFDIDRHFPIGIFYGYPSDSYGWLRGHQFKIGMYRCDSDRIPFEWVAECNQCQLITVPSQFNEQVFRQSGVRTEIMVVKHGIESAYIPLNVKPFLPSKFTFFTSWFSPVAMQRKGITELIDAFARKFAYNQDVCLVLHHSPRDQRVGPCIEQARKSGANIVSITDQQDLNHQQMAALLNSMNVLVNCARSGGFELMPLQAKACGVPCILTNTPPQDEYFNPNHGDTGVRCYGTERISTYQNSVGSMPIIDQDSLANALEYAYNNFKELKAMAMASGGYYRRFYRWPVVLQPVMERLRRLTAIANRDFNRLEET